MEQYLEIAGVVVGVIYLWLEYKASIYLWVASVVMPAIYLFVYYDAGLYADTAINIYYLAIALYGWAAWKWGFSFSRKAEEQPQKELPISHITTRGWIAMAALYVVMQLAITTALTYLTDPDSLIVGDQVVTSGLGGYLPGGLVIGAVREVRIDDGGVNRYAVVKAKVVPEKLVQVFVICGFDGEQ